MALSSRRQLVLHLVVTGPHISSLFCQPYEGYFWHHRRMKTALPDRTGLTSWPLGLEIVIVTMVLFFLSVHLCFGVIILICKILSTVLFLLMLMTKYLGTDDKVSM